MADYTAGLIDVFADAPLHGNPLAVFEGGENLADEQLRLIAREFNQAETTFIMPSPRADRRLRSFTAAGSEVFGAGHNALGAWLWLALTDQLGGLGTARTFHQEIGAMVLPLVLHERDGRMHGTMTQSAVRLLATASDAAKIEAALGLQRGAVLPYPAPRTVDTGAPHLMVRLKDGRTIDEAKPITSSLLAVLKDAGAEGCYCYAFDEARPSRAYARFFNPTVGLWEDAATGTAAGPLAAYLGSEGLLDDGALLIEQGVQMGRRSLLSIRLTPDPALSGSGVIVLKGRLSI